MQKSKANESENKLTLNLWVKGLGYGFRVLCRSPREFLFVTVAGWNLSMGFIEQNRQRHAEALSRFDRAIRWFPEGMAVPAMLSDAMKNCNRQLRENNRGPA